MKKTIALTALLIFSVDVPYSVADTSQVRIMPLGDSLTSGYSVPTYLSGYRDGLYSLLTDAGYNVDFVGTQIDTQNPALPDPDHEGHGGYRIDQIGSGILGWLDAGNPDVILLLIGTNDFWQNYDTAGASGRLENLVAQISSLRPAAKILVANLPLRTDSASMEAAQSAFNASIPGIVSGQVSLGRHVYFVDMHSSFSAAGLSSDGVHPNPAGYGAMADVWAQAVMQVITPQGTTPSVLADGSFELGSLISANPFPQYQLDGWAVTGVPFGFPGISNCPATDGSRMAMFNGGSDIFTGTVSQTFATTPGATYQLNFDFGIIAAAGKAPRQQLLGVAVSGEGGGSLFAQDAALTAIEGPAQWTARSYSFTATTATTTLAFTDKSGTLSAGVAAFCDALLDHVRVSEVPSNTAPVADDDSYATTEGIVLVVAAPGVLDGDTDVDSPTLAAVLVAGPSHGSLTLNPNGSFTYTPNSGFSGTDSFSYKASDGFLDSSAAMVSIVVNPAGQFANGSFELGALISANPFPQCQLDGWAVTGVPFGFPGTLNCPATDGSRMAMFNGGSDNFTGMVSQTFATTPGATYQLNFDFGIIAAAGKAPRQQLLEVAVAGEGGGSLFAQDVALTAIEGPAQWTARSFSFTATTATTTLAFTDKSGTLSAGVADFCDALLDHVRVSVNTAPVADDDSYSTAWGTTLAVTSPGVLDGDTDADSPGLTAVLVAGPSNGSLTLNPNGSFTYTPNSGFAGTDSFSYKANDGFLDSNAATVAIVVNPAGPFVNGSFELGVLISSNPFPQYRLEGWTVTGVPLGFPAKVNCPATDGSRMALFNGGCDTFTGTISQAFATIPGAIYQLDFDFGIIAAAGKAPRQQLLGVAVTGEGGGSLFAQDVALTAIEGSAQWTPRSYSFTATTATTTLVFTDKSGTLSAGVADFCDALLDQVRVAISNNPPLALADAYTTSEDTLLTVAANGVLANDSDPESSTLNAILVDPISSGSLTLNPNGGFDFTPASNFVGAATFSYKANDSALDSNVVTVTITVDPVTDNYADWLAEFGTAGNPGDDPDRDSITNAVEYVVGGNPKNQSNVALLPSISLVSEIPNPNFVIGNYLRFTYRRTQLANNDPSTTIRAEWNESLTGPWTIADGSHGEVIVEVPNGADTGIDRVDVYILCPPSGMLFGRLGVAIDTP
jgi:lysophospholipase L1-like esterase